MNAARRRYETVMVELRTALLDLAGQVATVNPEQLPPQVRAASERVAVAREALEEEA